MIQFYLTKDLAKDLAELPLTPDQEDEGAIIWYAHRVTIARRKCIIAMEYQSRYAMVFCGLTKPDFKNFADIFAERLWREACVVTQLQKPLPEVDIQVICDLAAELSHEQTFTAKSDRSVQSHINQVKEHLEDMVLRDGYPLPVDDDDAMRFGLIANDMLRKRKGDKDYFVPLEEYREFWLGFVEHVKGNRARINPAKQSARTIAKTASDTEKGPTVIAVDFVNKCRQ